MRALRLSVVVLAAVLSSACLIVSLQPVYEPETIAFDPALLGTWISTDGDLSVTFERGEWHSYHLTLTERDRPTRLSARLTRVGERLYLDLSPRDGADIAPLVLPVHAVYRVEVNGDDLWVADLNYERLAPLAHAGTAGLPTTIDARKNVVITASTPELRRWLVEHAADEGLFAPPTALRRAPAPKTPTPR